MRFTKSTVPDSCHSRILPACLFGVVAAASLSLAQTATAETELQFQPCRIGIAPMTAAAECASLEVSFTHGLTPITTQGDDSSVVTSNETLPEFITLSIARLSARNRQTESDPLTLLAGGPGQSAQESWPQLQFAFQPILANRDIYLIDQRGTGKSAVMKCPSPPPGSELSTDLTAVEQAASDCHSAQAHPSEWFTSSVAVRDLDAVRKALNIEQWNLYGVSYGTRVALHYMRRFPEHTSSVILDAVVPPEKTLGPELPIHAQLALDALMTRCSMESGCAEAFPDLANQVEKLFRSLKDNPRQVQFENLSRGALESMLFSDKHLAMSVRLLSYSAYGNAILPSMLYDAAVNENFAPFARQIALQESELGSTMATGMHAAVICTEDAPYIESMASRDSLQNTFLGDFIVDAIVAGCKPWPLGVMDEDFHEPITSSIPVLALSGSVDPITPPAYAELALQQLNNSRHIVNEHQAHTQAPLGCMPTILLQFIETKNPTDLNIDCLDRLKPPALFVDANGPLP